MIGQTVSHYTILGKLGEGGMGVVYMAHDTKLDRNVALKFLPPHLTSDSRAKEHFVHEAKAASALDHPNICNVHDIAETEDGQTFIVMAYYGGETLAKKMEEGPLTIEEAVSIATQVARGLLKAHDHGIVHRDIKPANIMIAPDGVVKIVDFGLAKLAGTMALTTAASTIGTAAYVSPEQIRGGEIDQRTDIWSFGVVFYELLTGVGPFTGPHENTLIYSILNTEPAPLITIRPSIPDRLEKVVLKCLAKNLAERYQSMGKVLDDLAACQVKASPTNRLLRSRGHPFGKPRGSTAYTLVGSVIFLSVISFILFFPKDGGQPHSRLKAIAVLPLVHLGPAEEEYFADGLTDEIASRLSSLSDLMVISSSSTIRYKKTNLQLSQIARELGVDYVLRGTVRWLRTEDSERILMSLRLINVPGSVQLWSGDIEKTPSNIFTVQSEIASKVADALGIAFGKGEKDAPESNFTRDIDAYRAYLRGLSFADRYEETSIRTAIEMFQRAVNLDSTFALAYALLARTHLMYFFYGYGHTQDRLDAAKNAIDRAFSLAPALPEAHLALGYYYYHGHRDYVLALEALREAQRNLPNDDRIFFATGAIWRRQGKFEASLEQYRKALDVNPYSATHALELGETYYMLGRYSEANQYLESSISVLPDQQEAYLFKATMYWYRGDTSRSRKELGRIPSQHHPWLSLVFLDKFARDYQSALDRLESAPVNTTRDTIEIPYWRGLIYHFMNDSVRSRQSLLAARTHLRTQVQAKVVDNWFPCALAVVEAALGNREAALRETDAALKHMPLIKDAIRGIYPLIARAEVYTLLGEQDAAIEQLAFLLSLSAPKFITAPLLRLDPMYEPLRGNPTFQALLKKHERGG